MKKVRLLLAVGAIAIALIFILIPNTGTVDENAWRGLLHKNTTKEISGPDILTPTKDTILQTVQNTTENIKEFTAETTEAAKDKFDTIKEKLPDSKEEFVQSITEEVAEEVLPPYIEKAELEYVIDGDTIIVKLAGNISWKIRFVGCNTPESVASQEYLDRTNKENSQEGRDASAFTKELLKGKKFVYLQKDVSETDTYSRLLRYVWITPPTAEKPEDISLEEFKTNCLNGILSYYKVAEPMIMAPDNFFADYIQELYEMEVIE